MHKNRNQIVYNSAEITKTPCKPKKIDVEYKHEEKQNENKEMKNKKTKARKRK